ncbi:Rho1 guanine nucleotide exchange factor 1 [Smittium mucronatum]|uniref:Rho1 guanine nucleotide exchange factor 1 n=1 Tax=Smittium mucronatum TaxID=133383 RepID=A0A1R0H277_9FUNG|nr:Rho1 guanine nucleotide exchange factor 1 [Smittium mucronatum]
MNRSLFKKDKHIEDYSISYSKPSPSPNAQGSPSPDPNSHSALQSSRSFSNFNSQVPNSGISHQPNSSNLYRQNTTQNTYSHPVDPHLYRHNSSRIQQTNPSDSPQFSQISRQQPLYQSSPYYQPGPPRDLPIPDSPQSKIYPSSIGYRGVPRSNYSPNSPLPTAQSTYRGRRINPYPSDPNSELNSNLFHNNYFIDNNYYPHQNEDASKNNQAYESPTAAKTSPPPTRYAPSIDNSFNTRDSSPVNYSQSSSHTASESVENPLEFNNWYRQGAHKKKSYRELYHPSSNQTLPFVSKSIQPDIQNTSFSEKIPLEHTQPDSSSSFNLPDPAFTSTKFDSYYNPITPIETSPYHRQIPASNSPYPQSSTAHDTPYPLNDSVPENHIQQFGLSVRRRVPKKLPQIPGKPNAPLQEQNLPNNSNSSSSPVPSVIYRSNNNYNNSPHDVYKKDFYKDFDIDSQNFTPQTQPYDKYSGSIISVNQPSLKEPTLNSRYDNISESSVKTHRSGSQTSSTGRVRPSRSSSNKDKSFHPILGIDNSTSTTRTLNPSKSTNFSLKKIFNADEASISTNMKSLDLSSLPFLAPKKKPLEHHKSNVELSSNIDNKSIGQVPRSISIDNLPCYSPTCAQGTPCYSPSCPHFAGSNGPNLNLSKNSQKLWVQGVPKSVSSKLSKSELLRQELIFEVFTTEREYVRDLIVLRDIFQQGLEYGDVIPEAKRAYFIQSVFRNLDEIIQVNSSLLKDLEIRKNQALICENIGDIFLDHLNSFQCYIPYTSLQPLGKHILDNELSVNSNLVEYIRLAERSPECRKLPITSFLGRPMSRLARYPLLFSAILKHTPESNPDAQDLKSANELLKSILEKINLETGKNSNKLKLIDINERLFCTVSIRNDLDLLNDKRQLIRTGILKRKVSDGGDVTAMLFDHMLILCKERKLSNGQLEYRLLNVPIPLLMLTLSYSTEHEKPKANRSLTGPSVYVNGDFPSGNPASNGLSGGHDSEKTNDSAFRSNSSNLTQSLTEVVKYTDQAWGLIFVLYDIDRGKIGLGSKY